MESENKINIPSEKVNTLTQLELRVYLIILDGKSDDNPKSVGNKEIAEELGVSRKEVKKARKSIVSKLNLKQGF